MDCMISLLWRLHSSLLQEYHPEHVPLKPIRIMTSNTSMHMWWRSCSPACGRGNRHPSYTASLAHVSWLKVNANRQMHKTPFSLHHRWTPSHLCAQTWTQYRPSSPRSDSVPSWPETTRRVRLQTMGRDCLRTMIRFVDFLRTGWGKADV